jgi:glutamyl-tRNA reductase
MEILAVGLNHQTAPIALRERLDIPDPDLPAALDRLARAPGLLERMILSTCNRVEVYAVAAAAEPAVEAIVAALADAKGVPAEAFRPSLYVHRAREAVRHIFRVASSLDSLVVGEPQILGQVKAAHAAAVAREATGAVLDGVLERAVRAARRVRSETAVAAAAASIPAAAVELAKKIFGELAGRTILVLGAGEMATVAVQHLVDEGVRSILIANRNLERAGELAARFHGRAVPFDEARLELLQADIVLASTGAPHLVLTRAELAEIMPQRRNRPLFLIDIAVPRDIDPAANSLDNVYLYDIDDLRAVVEGNLRVRRQEADRAEAIVEKEVGQFFLWLDSLAVVPTIVDLRHKVDAIRAAEVDKAFHRLPELTPAQRETISAMAASICNKILHHPLTELKRQAALTDGHLYVRALRRLFHLEEPE